MSPKTPWPCTGSCPSAVPAAMSTGGVWGARERYETVAVRHLARDIGGQHEGAVALVEAAEARIDHAQVARLAEIEPRAGRVQTVEPGLNARPGDDEQQQADGDGRQHELHPADEAAV